MARTLGALDAATLRQITRLLGNPPALDRLTVEVWDDITQRYSMAITRTLEKVFVQAAQIAAEGLVDVAWDMVNEHAANWAVRYTYDLVRGITATSQARIAAAVRDFYAGALDIEGVRARLEALFGPQRAATIAVTEITRAAVQGAYEYESELRNLEIQTVHIWHTANDEITCPVCAPNNGKRQEDGWTVDEPPAHPNCRCWISIEPVLPESKGR